MTLSSDKEDEIIANEADDIAAKMIKILVDKFKNKEGRDPSGEEVEQLFEELTEERVAELLGMDNGDIAIDNEKSDSISQLPKVEKKNESCETDKFKSQSPPSEKAIETLSRDVVKGHQGGSGESTSELSGGTSTVVAKRTTEEESSDDIRKKQKI